jgi:hypothetical protein
MKTTFLSLLAALSLAGLVAGCGSSSSSSSSTAASAAGGGTAGGTAGRAKLVACLKAHGVTLPSRPAGGQRPPGSGAGPGFFGGGRAGAPGAGGRAANPRFQAAIKACGGGSPGRRGGGTVQRAALQSFVTCVSKHGYQLPKPNLSGKGAIFPAKIATNAKFRAASRACTALLRPQGAPGGAPPSA